MNPSLFFLKLKHFLKRDKKYYAEAIANYLGDGYFALFFDADGEKSYEKIKSIIKIFCLGDEYYGIFKTKHGYQFIWYHNFSLSELKLYFDFFKGHIKSDYFWSVPLWLRVSEKFNEDGVISDKPKLIEGKDKRYLFKLKKLYRTWD